MKYLLCCVAATLLLSSSLAAIDVEKTVRQVQTILQANSQLPRLSRDEILQLLNDIRAEDAKNSASKELSKEISPSTPYSNDSENEISYVKKQADTKKKNEKTAINDSLLSGSAPTLATVESTTSSKQPTMMVVLPYTPRDGVSLEELYTKAPRVAVVPEVKVTPKPKTIQETLKTNAKIADSRKQVIPDELLAFLDSHGIKSNPNQNFLLPLEGFKPLPSANVLDGSIQLPENILLTYDLISPNSKLSESAQMTPQNYLFDPLYPEYPLELDTSSSESKKTVLPLDLPKTRKTKSTVHPPNFEPIDYDSVKVIPLKVGPSPVEDIKSAFLSDQSKRQINGSDEATTTVAPSSNTSTVVGEVKDAVPAGDTEAAGADTDSGASIADLEESFGGAVPAQPGDSELPPPRKNGFYWMVDWNSFLEVGDGDTKVNIRFEPKLGDPQMFLPVNVP